MGRDDGIKYLVVGNRWGRSNCGILFQPLISADGATVYRVSGDGEKWVGEGVEAVNVGRFQYAFLGLGGHDAV